MSDHDDLLHRLNGSLVTSEEIVEVNRTAELIHQAGKPAASNGFATITKLYRGDLDKAAAVYFRIQALARLLVEEGIPGWTLPVQPEGAIPSEDAVFEAAATEPLVQLGGDIVFDRTSFMNKVLEFTTPLGSA